MQKKDIWQSYSGPSHSSRRSSESTAYPESEQDSHGAYWTLGRTTISSCASNSRCLKREIEELANEDYLGPEVEDGQAGSSQAYKPRYCQTWNGLSVLVANEAKRFLHIQQDMHARNTEVSEQRAGRDICKSVPSKLKGTFTILQADDLYKTLKISRKAKKRRAIKEVFCNDPPTDQSLLLSSLQKGPVDASEEPANSPPELSHESQAENLAATEQLTFPWNELSCESQTPAAAPLSSNEECGEGEAIGTIDDTEEITILMELCDLVANSFSSQADPNDQRAEEWTTDTHHPQTLTVASCLEAEASLQGTSCKLVQGFYIYINAFYGLCVLYRICILYIYIF